MRDLVLLADYFLIGCVDSFLDLLVQFDRDVLQLFFQGIVLIPEQFDLLKQIFVIGLHIETGHFDVVDVVLWG